MDRQNQSGELNITVLQEGHEKQHCSCDTVSTLLYNLICQTCYLQICCTVFHS